MNTPITLLPHYYGNFILAQNQAQSVIFSFNPLTPGAFRKKTCFMDILAVFRLDFGQISFNLVKNAIRPIRLRLMGYWPFWATGLIVNYYKSRH